MKRKVLVVAAAVAAVTLTVSACSSSKGSSGGSKNNTVAGKLIMGGPPEFQTRRLPGLTTTYGVTFKGFTSTGAGGVNGVTSLKNGQVDAADIFTSDPAIKANNFVVLADPKSFFGAQNVVPLINKSKATDAVKTVLNYISSKLTSAVLIDLNTQVQVDKKDPAAVAEAWLSTLGNKPPANFTAGVSLTVGSANFTENETLADVYAIALQATGAKVKTKLNIGSREKYFPALLDGTIDLVPEYLGSILSYLDKNATAATADDVKTALATKLPSKLEILDIAEAQDNDAIVVTKAIADKYHLASIADLAKTA